MPKIAFYHFYLTQISVQSVYKICEGCTVFRVAYTGSGNFLTDLPGRRKKKKIMGFSLLNSSMKKCYCLGTAGLVCSKFSRLN